MKTTALRDVNNVHFAKQLPPFQRDVLNPFTRKTTRILPYGYICTLNAEVTSLTSTKAHVIASQNAVMFSRRYEYLRFLKTNLESVAPPAVLNPLKLKNSTFYPYSACTWTVRTTEQKPLSPHTALTVSCNRNDVSLLRGKRWILKYNSTWS
jgi:hypothetical protein